LETVEANYVTGTDTFTITPPTTTSTSTSTTTLPSTTTTTTTTTTTSTTTTSTTTTSTTTTTAVPVFPVVAGEVLDSVGDVVVADEALRSGFRVVSGPGAGAQAVAGRPVAGGHSGSGLELNLASSETVSGVVSRPVQGMIFWAKAPAAASGPSLQIGLAGALQSVSLIGDGLWHEYVVPFGLSAAASATIQLTGSGSGAGPVVLDDVVLVARPLPTISVTSSNGFVGPSPLMVTVSGLWRTAAYVLVMGRLVTPCSVCVVPLPASGIYSFVADADTYSFTLKQSTGGLGTTFASKSGVVVSASIETVPGVSLDANGDVIVLDTAMRSSFRTINGSTVSAANPTAVIAQTGPGRSGLALTLVESSSANWVGLFGSVPKTVRAAEFWAKTATVADLAASSGSTFLGGVSLITDNAWHRYVLPFPTDVQTGSPVLFRVIPPIGGPRQPVTIDSLKLVARPFETVSVASNNGFQGSSVITATVSGLWSGDAHFMSAVRTSDGGAACGGCLHVAVPASGSVAFPLTPGVYRVVVETGDAFSAVGVSATFTINAATTTTTTTTTTTLPEFTVAGNDVLNGYGEVVVLDDAFRSGFRMATPDAAAAPLVARATQGRSNAAVIFNPSTDAVRGLLRGQSTGVRFWAKVESGSGPSVYALVGGAARGTVSLTADGAWHEYTLPFGATMSSQELILLGNATGTAKFLLDDVALVLPPAPPVVTLPPTPPTYYVPRTVVDWRVKLNCLSFQNADGTGGITYDCVFATLEGSPPAFTGLVNPYVASTVVEAAGGVEEFPYGNGVYRKTHVVQDWFQGPPPATLPPVPQYRTWGVTINGPVFGPGITVQVLFGSPPANILQTYSAAATARNDIIVAGAIEETPGNFTFYSTTPPATTIPPQTTTTVAVVISTTTPSRPVAFSSYPNYLRSQKLKNDGAVAQCLTPGASSIQSSAAVCDSGPSLLSFAPFNSGSLSGYFVKQGNTCLQVDYNAPDSQVLLADNTPALKIGWVPCQSTGDDTLWVPTFVETDASNAGWYQLVPKYGRAGIANPCLNLNIGASQSTQMLVEYTCQGGTHTEERWAPNESFWTDPGGTGGTGGTPTTTTATTILGGVGTTIPPGTTFQDGIQSFLKTPDQSQCIGKGFSGEPILVASDGDNQCVEFIPSLTTGGFNFQATEGECLLVGGSSLAPSFAPCGPATVLVDRVTTYPLVEIRSATSCLTRFGTLVLLATCAGLATQEWVDPSPTASPLGFGALPLPNPTPLPVRPSLSLVPTPVAAPAGLSPVWTLIGSAALTAGAYLTYWEISSDQPYQPWTNYNSATEFLRNPDARPTQQKLRYNCNVVVPPVRGLAYLASVDAPDALRDQLSGLSIKDEVAGSTGFGPVTVAVAFYCIDRRLGLVVSVSSRNGSTDATPFNNRFGNPNLLTHTSTDAAAMALYANPAARWHAEGNILGGLIQSGAVTAVSSGWMMMAIANSNGLVCSLCWSQTLPNFINTYRGIDLHVRGFAWGGDLKSAFDGKNGNCHYWESIAGDPSSKTIKKPAKCLEKYK
jgi:hypothetical protein